MNHAATPPTSEPPTVTITREQLECWSGRPLTNADIARLDDCIPNSSIPEAIATIVASFDPDHDDATRYRINNHSNDSGDPYCAGNFGGRLSCAEVVKLDAAADR